MYIQDNDLSYIPKKNILSSQVSLMNYFYSLDNTDYKSKIVKNCFNVLYEDGLLLKGFYQILFNYGEVAEEGCAWYYVDEDEENFDKNHCVCFNSGFFESEVTVFLTEEENFQFSKLACERFYEIHPEWKDLLQKIVNDWTPKYV